MSIAKDILPVDVLYSNLLEWLVDRKKVPAKWQDPIRKCHDKLSSLKKITELSDPDMKSLLSKENVTYFDGKKILAFLEKTTESPVKNMFGQYNSPLLKEWNALLKAWERDNIYLAESSRYLVQYTTHECPAMKKSIIAMEKQISDANRRIQEYERSINSCERQYQDACKEWGITCGESSMLKTQLQDLTKELPTIYTEIEDFVMQSNIKEILEYYFQLLQLFSIADPSNKENTTGSTDPAVDIRDVYLLKLQSLIKGDKLLKPHSNNSNTGTTTNSYLPVKECGQGVDATGSTTADIDISGAAYELDWTLDTPNWDIDIVQGSSTITGDNNANIDFNIDYSSTVQDISWDITDSSDVTAVDINWDGAGVEVTPAGSGDASMTLNSYENSGTTIANTDGGIDRVVSAEESLLHPSDQLVSLLSSSTFREELLDDLAELRLFLQQKKSELAGGSSGGSSGEDQLLLSAWIQSQSQSHQATGSASASGAGGVMSKGVEDIQSYMESLVLIENKLLGHRLRQISQIAAGKVFIDRITKTIQRPREKKEKLRGLRLDAALKKQEAVATIAEITPRLEALRAATKSLKEDVEAAGEAVLGGRRIHIIGDINDL